MTTKTEIIRTLNDKLRQNLTIGIAFIIIAPIVIRVCILKNMENIERAVFGGKTMEEFVDEKRNKHEQKDLPSNRHDAF